jgi:PTS system glucitol/sorbitol-specific IIA component
MRHFSTVITQVSPEARELVEGGVLILFAEGAPPELAEVSVLHRVVIAPTAEPPAVGARLTFPGVAARITAIGDYAWKKIGDMGHVVINFNDATATPRPGEICVSSVDLAALAAALSPGAEISIEA